MVFECLKSLELVASALTAESNLPLVSNKPVLNGLQISSAQFDYERLLLRATQRTGLAGKGDGSQWLGDWQRWDKENESIEWCNSDEVYKPADVVEWVRRDRAPTSE